MNKSATKSKLVLNRRNKIQPKNASGWLRRTAFAVTLLGSHSVFAADTIQTVTSGQTDLTAAATYNPASVPTSTTDVEFTGTYSPAAFTLNGSLAIGTLDDVSATALTISDTGASAAILTLSSTANSVTGSAAADLIYVASGGTLAINAGAGVLGLALGTSGNFDAVGTLTIGSVISDGGSGFGITKTGTGTLNLQGANTYSGGTTINAGTVSVSAAGTLGSNVATNNVAVNGAILTLAAATNIGSAQTVSVGSSATTLGVLGLGFNSLPTITQSTTAPFVLAITAAGFNALTSEAALGNGNDFLGAIGTTATYTGTSLSADSDGVYRLGGGGGTLTVTNGVLTGTGSLLVNSTLTNGGGSVTLNAANSLSGTTTVATGSLNLSGASAGLSNSAVTVQSPFGFTVSSNATNVGTGVVAFGTGSAAGTTRAASITLSHATLYVNGTTANNTVDTVTGALTADGSNGFANPVVVAPVSTKNSLLTAGSLAQANGGVVLFAGTNLGANTIASATANNSNIQFTTAPRLVGGGGAAGTTNISIIPFAIGGTATGDTGSTFVTYTAANGIRPLNTSTEFDSTLTDGNGAGSGTATDNVRIVNTGYTLNTGATINSLIFTPTASTTISGGTIAVTSGAVILNPSASNYANLTSGLAFGSAQGVIGTSYNRAVTIGSAISGSGGLVIYNLTQAFSNFTTSLGSTANTYTGDTYIEGNEILNSNNFLPSGSRTGDLYISGSLQLNTSVAPTINGLNGTGTLSYGHSVTTTVTLGDNNANGNFSGTLSQTSANTALTKIGMGTQILSGNVTFKGTTTVSAGTLLINGTTNQGLYSVAGGTLGGSGTINANASTITIGAGGTITGGTATTPGMLTLTTTATTGVVFNGTSASLATYLVNISGPTGSNLKINGALTLTTGSDDHITIVGTPTASSYDLINYTGTSLTGGFTEGTSDLPAGYTLAYNTDEIDLVSMTSVPEPSTWAAGCLSLGTAGWALQKRRRAAKLNRPESRAA